MSPKAKLPLGSATATKSISGEYNPLKGYREKVLTFYQRGGLQKVRAYSMTTYEPTPAQAAQRAIIKAKVEAWQALSDVDKASWNAQAELLGDPWSGYTFFMSTFEVELAEPADIMDFRVPGRYFNSDLCYGPVTTCSVLSNYVMAYPFYCGPSQSFDRIAIRVTSYSRRSYIRFGLYSSLENPYPGSPLIDSGEHSSGSTGVKETVIDWTSEDNLLYWFVILCSRTPKLRGLSEYYSISSMMGQTDPPSTTGYYGYAVPQSYGSLPDPYPGPVGYSGYPPPAVFLRKKPL